MPPWKMWVNEDLTRPLRPALAFTDLFLLHSTNAVRTRWSSCFVNTKATHRSLLARIFLLCDCSLLKMRKRKTTNTKYAGSHNGHVFVHSEEL